MPYYWSRVFRRSNNSIAVRWIRIHERQDMKKEFILYGRRKGRRPILDQSKEKVKKIQSLRIIQLWWLVSF